MHIYNCTGAAFLSTDLRSKTARRCSREGRPGREKANKIRRLLRPEDVRGRDGREVTVVKKKKKMILRLPSVGRRKGIKNDCLDTYICIYVFYADVPPTTSDHRI